MDGEIVREVVPHIGYLHRCFEKHAENLPYNQVIPFVDRLTMWRPRTASMLM